MTQNNNNTTKLNKINNIATIAVIIAILIIAVFVIFYGVANKNTPDIVSNNGIAYVQYEDMTAKLLDSNGKQIIFNDFIKQEHKLYGATYSLGYVTYLVVFDESTNMHYIGVINSKDNVELTEINVLYNKELLEGAN